MHSHRLANATTLFILTWAASCYLLEGFIIHPQHRHLKVSTNHNTRLEAKSKKKGKKKKSNKKQSGFEWATSFTLKPFEAASTRDLVSAALASFEGRTGKPLTSELIGVGDLPKALWNSKEVACVIVDKLEEGSMIVKYANIAALETVGLKADEYQCLMGGDDVEQTITLDLPTEMKGEKRYESGYNKKILRGDNDDDLTIVDAHRWALEKSALVDGKFVSTTIGVCYAWSEWGKGEDTLCEIGGNTKPWLKVEDLEENVAKQASLVRKLKEEEGLGNKDPRVADAVKELLRLKDQLAGIKK